MFEISSDNAPETNIHTLKNNNKEGSIQKKLDSHIAFLIVFLYFKIIHS